MQEEQRESACTKKQMLSIFVSHWSESRNQNKEEKGGEFGLFSALGSKGYAFNSKRIALTGSDVSEEDKPCLLLLVEGLEYNGMIVRLTKLKEDAKGNRSVHNCSKQALN